jgi:iron(III)-enterobactin esterase
LSSVAFFISRCIPPGERATYGMAKTSKKTESAPRAAFGKPFPPGGWQFNLSLDIKKFVTSIGIASILACLSQGVIVTAARGAGAPPPTRLPTDPGTPALTPAGPDAADLAQAALKKAPSANDAAANPTKAASGANPPLKVEGNYLIGPTYVRAPELSVVDGVPQGKVQQFSMNSADSKFYPGMARNAFGTVDPNNPKTLIVETHPAPYKRAITVYIPSQYVPGTAAPFIVTHDGQDRSLPRILDNMIAQHRLPVMLAIGIANGGGDAQGNERGLEYDTMSGKFAEFIETEVLPLVESNCGVKLTKDPEGRATMGGSSGGSAALEMAWYHPEWYHRVITYSGTYVNQQWPFNPETPGGAWDFHEKLIPQSAPKPIRLWLEVGDRDLLNPNIMRDNMHDWVAANLRMATVLRAKGYHYQFVFALNAGHVDGAVKNQTLPEALEWVWQGYPVSQNATPAATGVK